MGNSLFSAVLRHHLLSPSLDTFLIAMETFKITFELNSDKLALI